MDQEDIEDAYDAHVGSAQRALDQAWKFAAEWPEQSVAYSAIARVELDLAREIREASRACAHG